MESKFGFVLRSAYETVRKRRVKRDTREVLGEYDASWKSFRETLASSGRLEDWLAIEGFDRRRDWFNVDGRLFFGTYNSSDFYRSRLKWALDTHFKGINSITEYGAGIGRNLLFLKSRYPQLRCYGYELVPAGVEIAQAAARKFGLAVEYAQLDYLNDPAAKFVFPATDAAFTLFSLEQLPERCDEALRNILARTRVGSVHLEPVPENYPYSLRGMIGRLDHAKAGYLRGFPDAVSRQSPIFAWHERMTSAHNPLMFPSLYILKKEP